MKIIALLVVLLFCSIGVSSATDYYVSTSGNNSLNGTSIGNAWLTLNKAADTVVAGDTAYIVNGTYYPPNNIDFKNSGNSTHPIKMVAYNGTPLILGNIWDGTIDFNETQYVNVSGFEIFSNCRKVEMTGSNNTLHNCILHGSNTQNMIGITNSNHIIDGNTFYNQSGDPNVMDITSYYKDGVTVHDITISNNIFHNITGHNAINLKDNYNDPNNRTMYNMTISNNTIYDGRTNFIAIGTNWINLYDSTISDNTVYDCDAGISIYAIDSVFEFNHVYNVTPGISLGTNDRAIYNTTYDSNNATLSLKGQGIVITNHTYGVVSIAAVDSTATMKDWFGTKSINLKFKGNIIFEQSVNYIHKFIKASGSDSYTSISPRYYPSVSNSSLNLTVDTSTYWNLYQYNISLTPSCGYLFDVVINNYDIITDDNCNVTINSSLSDNPSVITTIMANATANYNVSIDGVSQGTFISDSDGLVTYNYNDSWSEKTFNFSWSSSAINQSPSIINHTPSSPNSTVVNTTQTFNIVFDQTGNVSWYMNTNFVHTNISTSTASYTNSTAPIGTYNITAIMSNINGTATQKWDWTVTSLWTPLPNRFYVGFLYSVNRNEISTSANVNESAVISNLRVIL